MMLSGWIKNNKGTIARIGTKSGSGFIFAGRVDSFTLFHITAYTGVYAHSRRIVSVYDSVYGGSIVIVEGKECGTIDCPFDKTEAFDDIPIEHYQRLADSMCASYAEDYRNALIKRKFSRHKKEINAAEATMHICRQFFLSDQFAVLMPHASGKDVLRLIEEKVEQMYGNR